LAAASTHPGEEQVMIDAHRRLRTSFPRLLTLIAPRHPERGREIVNLVAAAGLKGVLRSAGKLPEATADIYVCDTLGELGMVYRLAPIVFMGGSLVAHGGQNPIEAIKLGAAILHGPFISNVAEIYAALDGAKGADLVSDAARLAKQAGAWLKDEAARRRIVAAGQKTVEALGGALGRTLAALDPYLLQLRLEHHA
jgi:3-deoxy-D-manno-octulosonic-acid transferase